MKLERLTVVAGLLFLAACSPETSDSDGQHFVLAASWQPAFCETRPKLRECASQTARRFDASHFALHGLWPQPRSESYCGVDGSVVATDKAGRWHDLPWQHLPRPLWDRLRKVMPGTMSGLHKHEWIKHGSCMDGADSTDYFAVSLDLMDHLNASRLRTLFADRIGWPVSGEEIRAAFEEDFGNGTGTRLRIACVRDGDRQLVREITIGLTGKLVPGTSKAALAGMIAAAPPTDPGCPGGIVDPTGFQ